VDVAVSTQVLCHEMFDNLLVDHIRVRSRNDIHMRTKKLWLSKNFKCIYATPAPPSGFKLV